MGRKERRALERQKRKDDALREIREEIAYRAQVNAVTKKAIDDASEYTKNHITGEFYTAAAITLRKPPYRWPQKKVMNFLALVGGIINDLNEGTIHDSDLVTEGEKWGIRVLWSANHEYITEMDIFEEQA